MRPLSGRTRESQHYSGLWRDKRGMSAVEFALLAPIILLIYVGVAEIGNLLTVERRIEAVASTAADLTAQVKTVANSDLSDISDASKSILAPYDTAPLKIVLSSVVADQSNNGKVAWSYSKSGSARAVGSAFTLPPGTTEAKSSVIVAEVFYAFKPLLGIKIPGLPFNLGPSNLNRTFYARPRRSLTVAKN
jgi:Flp pilus assembly protein TadG